MTPFEAIRRLETTLAAAGLTESRIEAEALVMHVLGMNRTALYMAWRDPIVSDEQRESLNALGNRRLRREPLAYILGHREFYGLDFLVDERVLIPRPETELLVDLALETARSMDMAGALTVADICTGSGAIAISLAINLPRAVVWATDISRDALEVASANARLHGVEQRIHFAHGDLLVPLSTQFDILVSNPPYVPKDILKALEPEVLREPSLALDGGEQGLSVIRRLLTQAARGLTDSGVFLMEFSPEQAEGIAGLAAIEFVGAQVGIVRDLAGMDRFLIVRTAHRARG
ncbi:MAG: release factor glutamine methyltransferase [Chloroflexi bacterium]|nr:MAG: release factor glutamine methyltransferase [Chloroflexota bacterium]